MSDDPARARFAIITFVRLAGVALVLLGILAARGVFALPELFAYGAIMLGLFGVFVAPRILARRWRSPE